ncbi:unnamed protein product, partial [Phaeothamnion confervicola]
QAIEQLLGLGQFMDASIYFAEALEVMAAMPASTLRDHLEISLLMQGCQLTQFMEGCTENLARYARRAHDMCLAEASGDTPSEDTVLRIEPVAALSALLVQQAQFTEAERYTDAALKGWERAGRPAPLCLGMYEPVVTLMSMNVLIKAAKADDSSHTHWLNQLERYLKDSTASHRPFHLYASMSLFGTLYPVCLEYHSTVRFYHSVYRVVMLPIRRGLLYQLPTAESRVHAENPIVTQGIETMSLMCKIYESNTKRRKDHHKKAHQAFGELMATLVARPDEPTCAAVYQSARLLHDWAAAADVVRLW